MYDTLVIAHRRPRQLPARPSNRRKGGQAPDLTPNTSSLWWGESWPPVGRNRWPLTIGRREATAVAASRCRQSGRDRCPPPETDAIVSGIARSGGIGSEILVAEWERVWVRLLASVGGVSRRVSRGPVASARFGPPPSRAGCAAIWLVDWRRAGAGPRGRRPAAHGTRPPCRRARRRCARRR